MVLIVRVTCIVVVSEVNTAIFIFFGTVFRRFDSFKNTNNEVSSFLKTSKQLLTTHKDYLDGFTCNELRPLSCNILNRKYNDILQLD